MMLFEFLDLKLNVEIQRNDWLEEEDNLQPQCTVKENGGSTERQPSSRTTGFTFISYKIIQHIT